MTQIWRTVRVFISSTFRDMHAERDYLVRMVFPELKERCRKRHIQLVDVDLRWGVTEEQAEGGGALDICLDEIDSCRPYFLGLLGWQRVKGER
jgi:telomerase protein component 1